MDYASKRELAHRRLHAGLPRQAPGAEEMTAQALRHVPPLRAHAQVFDIGCGPGRSTLVLARELNTKITALDLNAEFLQHLESQGKQQGLSNHISTICGDMVQWQAPAGSIDLLWIEGALFIPGFDWALENWRSYLADDGVIVGTELSWLTDEPSREPVDFWRANYPGMRSVSNNILAAEARGYACLHHFTLPARCWWDEYYTPWSQRIESLKGDSDEYLQQFIAEAEEEIDMYRRFGSEYGYTFYILQKSNIRLEPAVPNDGEEIARVFRRSRDATAQFLPLLHTPQEDKEYFTTQVIPNNRVIVAKNDSNEIVGFIACASDVINFLYLLPEYMHRGIGTQLLNLPKLWSSRLQLWTFQRSGDAQRFYQKHGFKAIKETDGADNEEKEPDVLFEWTRV